MRCLWRNDFQGSNRDYLTVGYANNPTATVQADPKTKQVKIETQASQTAIESAITAAGYQVA